MPSKRNLSFLLLTIGVVVGVTAREPIKKLLCGSTQTPVKPGIKLPPSPEKLAQPHLDRAEQECERIIEEHVKVLDTFFADSKTNTRTFAEEALSWGSKWRLVADKVPFTTGGQHEKYIRERFEEHVFKPSDLEIAVKQVVSSYLTHVRSVENKMLVDLRTDVAAFPSVYLLAQLDEETIAVSYEEALARVTDATGGEVATEIVSLIAGEVLGRVAVRLGVSSGVLAIGGASGWATFGVGVVVGLIVDQIVSWVWDRWADPKGSLAADLDKKLDEIHRLIVDGADGDDQAKAVQGLRGRLKQSAHERIAVRRQAVLTLLQPQAERAK